jgi:hypothetical protein
VAGFFFMAFTAIGILTIIGGAILCECPTNLPKPASNAALSERQHACNRESPFAHGRTYPETIRRGALANASVAACK